jgi:hypothetical protein
MHLTVFGKRLDNDQVRIKQYGITIFDKDKLEFYLKKYTPQTTSTKKR